MNFRKQLIVFVLFDLVVISALGLYLLLPVPLYQGKVGELSGLFPRWESEEYTGSPFWEGKVFQGSLGKLEVVWRDGEACGKVKPPSPMEVKKTPYGTLFLSTAPHGYIAGFYFCGSGKLFWVDMTSWSHLSRNLSAFARVVESLKLNGKPVFPAEVKFKTGWPHIKDSLTLFLLATLGILLLSGLYLALFPFFGACPRRTESCFPSSLIKFRGKFLAKSRPCCVCVEDGKIKIYTRGYEPLIFSLEEAEIQGTTLRLPQVTLYLNSPLRLRDNS